MRLFDQLVGKHTHDNRVVSFREIKFYPCLASAIGFLFFRARHFFATVAKSEQMIFVAENQQRGLRWFYVSVGICVGILYNLSLYSHALKLLEFLLEVAVKTRLNFAYNTLKNQLTNIPPGMRIIKPKAVMKLLENRATVLLFIMNQKVISVISNLRIYFLYDLVNKTNNIFVLAYFRANWSKMLCSVLYHCLKFLPQLKNIYFVKSISKLLHSFKMNSWHTMSYDGRKTVYTYVFICN